MIEGGLLFMNNQTVLELNNRTLDNCLFSLIIIPTKIYYKEGENLVNEKEIYLFFYVIFKVNVNTYLVSLRMIILKPLIGMIYYSFLNHVVSTSSYIVLYQIIFNWVKLLN